MKETIRPWARTAGKVGHISHGLIYATVGLMALHVFPGSGENSTDFIGVLNRLVQSMLGKVYITLLAGGFFGFAAWRLVQVIWDTEQMGKKINGTIMRAVFALLGIAYGYFGWRVLSLLWRGSSTSGDQKAESSVAQLLGTWYGPWLIGLAAAIISFSALYQFFQAFTVRFKATLKERELRECNAWLPFLALGCVGLVARGVLFGMLAGMLVWSWVTHDPQKAGSHGDAISIIAQAPMGLGLVMAEAAGLIIYGLFAALQAKYRYILMEEKEWVNR
ncbi:MAG: DUF1206 domain-containing protein [Chitinivibrionales bacterium]|nr:DUF1206 domain-containing protein [Chitinivibrionales bacterium]MBD3355973.1 DUF1206 domain-containing protein [Chitinivibrionales bacterium]